MNATCRVLHLHGDGDGDSGDSRARAMQMIDAFGPRCTHSIVQGAGAIDPGITVDRPDFPALAGRPTPGRLQRLARAMQGHDLVLTYGYGAIDAALAHTLCRGYLPLPPLVHHEDGIGAQGTAANWVRRIALGRAAALIVSSRRLETLALTQWHQPRWRVKRIAPAIRTAEYAAKPRRDALPRVIKRKGELWLGIFAAAAPAGTLIALLPMLADLAPCWQLVIIGEHPQRGAISDEALRRDLGHRLHWPGAVDPSRALGLFDIFVPSAGGAASPTTIIQAMAAGLAMAATDVDEITTLLAPENRPFVVAPGDAAGLAAGLRMLADAPDLRARIGAANWARARANHDEAAMVAAYRAVYAAALGRPGFP